MIRAHHLVIVLALGGLLQTGCITVNLAGDDGGSLKETVVSGDDGPKILMIGIDGMITNTPSESLLGASKPSTAAQIRAQLDRARQDDDVAALLLRIDTPGGSATASEILYQEIVRFKRERRIPVVAQLMGTATSGGYYAAMAADHVVAHPTTVTGSIGVIFINLEITGLMSKLGIEDRTLTGGVHKDAGSPLRSMTAEERAQLQSIIDDLHGRFRTVVDEGRPELDRAQVDALSDGRVFSASQARESGLVDRIGSLSDTVAMIAKRLGQDEVQVVRYTRPREARASFYDRAPRTPVVNVDLGSWLGPLRRPGFHFLWWPGVE